MKYCKNCEFSGYYGNKLVCWLYSDDEVICLDAEEIACDDYKERREHGEFD